MNAYVLSHDLRGEQGRLALMSELLDPTEREHILRLGLQPGWRCLEVGCGNGSIAQWLATQVGPDGHVVASDLETSYLAGLQAPCLEVRQLDVQQDPLEQAHYDLVVTRALLHHLPSPELALRRMIGALKPGGVLLVTEPDMLPATVAEPVSVRDFWRGWFRWAEESGIDYFVGSKIAPLMDSLGLTDIAAEGRSVQFNGGSPWAIYCAQSVRELQPKIAERGHVSDGLFADFYRHFEDPHYWTSAINFVAAWGRRAP